MSTIHVDQHFGAQPLTVSFSVIVTGGTPAGFLWSFGDGAGAFGNSPVHTYNTVGVHTVFLTITYADHTQETVIAENLIRVVKLSFNGVPLSGIVPLTVAFQDQTIGCTGIECYDYSWSFGDLSASGTGMQPAHTYTTNGNFSVVMGVKLRDVT